MKQLTIQPNDAGQRLDKFLIKALRLPASFLYKALRKKRIKLDGARAHGSEILREGQVLSLYLNDDPTVSLNTLDDTLNTGKRTGSDGDSITRMSLKVRSCQERPLILRSFGNLHEVIHLAVGDSDYLVHGIALSAHRTNHISQRLSVASGMLQ